MQLPAYATVTHKLLLMASDLATLQQEISSHWIYLTERGEEGDLFFCVGPWQLICYLNDELDEV